VANAVERWRPEVHDFAARGSPQYGQCMPRVVIVGAGFAGLSAAKALARIISGVNVDARWDVIE
jgi:NADPH-dependent 2,4-dienoyl-CoA reductase/sulfur reductase-like enzyme